ncbi:hypothetical protein MPER_14418 [Moniliophthora perniciosa FA553]|nr:hypothetical protein MPER_14418 [Moniliophthora perniciosa FA553]
MESKTKTAVLLMPFLSVLLYMTMKAILVPLVFISLATNALGVVATSVKVKAQFSNLESDSNWELFSVGSQLQIGYYCANAGVNGFLTLFLGVCAVIYTPEFYIKTYCALFSWENLVDG